MNEWGIPDWRDESAYGQTELWSKFRWHWEFLRRRSDLRSEFDERCDEEYRKHCELYESIPDAYPAGVPKPNEPGFTVMSDLISGTISKRLPNPRIGNQPEEIIRFEALVLAEFFERTPPKGYCRIDFDLSKPLGPQLKAAKQHLDYHQISYAGKRVQNRKHKSKWLTYLRILDGKEQGASYADLADILQHVRDDPLAARDAHRQAEALCFNF